MDRPAKKPRRHEPEGFQKSRPTTPYKLPESITKFVSAFDESPTKKKRSIAANERPRNPFVDSDVSKRLEPVPSNDRPSASKRSGVVKGGHDDLTPLKPPPAAAAPHTARAESSSKTTSTSSLSSLQPVLKLPPPPRSILKPPPVPRPAAAAPQTTHVGPSSNTTSTSSLSSLQPMLKLPHPPEKPRFILKPPPVPTSSRKPSAQLKPLAPPPLPVPATSPKKPMGTILTTNIAQAIDPTKEGAGPELLSLFLQQHGHTFTSSTDRELQRGVMVSPDKRSRGKDRKFIRGGLAERFEHRIACAKTDLVLWKRQTEQKMASGTKMTPDMQLRVLRVLDVSKAQRTSRAPIGPRAGLALCRLVRRHPLADLTLGTYVVVFHFAPTDGASRSAVSSADRFEEGNDLMVWMPWHKVELVGIEGGRGLLDMFRSLDALMPPRSLLVVSRFCLVAPRVVDAT